MLLNLLNNSDFINNVILVKTMVSYSLLSYWGPYRELFIPPTAPRRSVRGHLFINFGMSWDVSGSGLGTFSDRFGMVLAKMSDGFEK